MRRRHKSRRTGKSGMIMIIISFLIIINMAGVSYASWKSGSNITAMLSLGNINPVFTASGIYGNGSQIMAEQSSNLIRVYGTITKGQAVNLQYSVSNNGSIPIRLGGQAISSLNGVGLSLTAPENGQGQGNLGISANEVGIYDFSITLPYRQFNY